MASETSSFTAGHMQRRVVLALNHSRYLRNTFDALCLEEK